MVAVAEKIAPYRHPRLSNVKVAGDRDKPMLPERETLAELRAGILADMAELGILPTELKLVEDGSHKFTDDIAKTGDRSRQRDISPGTKKNGRS